MCLKFQDKNSSINFPSLISLTGFLDPGNIGLALRLISPGHNETTLSLTSLNATLRVCWYFLCVFSKKNEQKLKSGQETV